MTERHAFLRAIKDHPDDDTPRLVFADWLDEHGEPERAAELRHACRVADYDVCIRENGFGLCDGMLGPEFHVEGFGKTGRVVSVAFLAPGRRPASFAFTFARGVVEQVECSWAAWLEHGDRLYDLERPWRVRLTTRPAIHTWYSTDGIAEYSLFGRKAVVGADQLAPDADAAPVLCAMGWPGTDFEIDAAASNDVPYHFLPFAPIPPAGP